MHSLIAQFLGASVTAFAIWMAVRITNGKRPTRRLIARGIGTLCVLLCTWVALAELQLYRQMRAIATVERRGGSVVVIRSAPAWVLRMRPDEKVRPGSGIGPNWLRKLLPFNRVSEYSLVVKEVWLDNCNGFHPHSDLSGERDTMWDSRGIRLTANDLAQLTIFADLEMLNLGETEIGDTEILAIRDLRGLKELRLIDTHVTDASLETIARFEKLEVLDLGETAITDAGLVKLLNLRHLKQIDVRATGVTDEGLAAFRRRLKSETYPPH